MSLSNRRPMWFGQPAQHAWPGVWLRLCFFRRLGVVVGFSTAPGHVSYEGPHPRNSFFTAALVSRVVESGHTADVVTLFRHVRAAVLTAAAGFQEPWIAGSLGERATLMVEGAASLSTVVRAFPGHIHAHEVFSGRADILAQLLGHGALSPSHDRGTVSLLTGLGGVGKSAVAREVCRRARLMYPGGVYWWDADSVVSLDRSLRGMGIRPPLNIAALRDPAVKPDDVRDAVLGWLASSTGWLVVMDNADNPGFLGPYVPSAAVACGGHLLVTSRCSAVERNLWKQA